MRGILEASLKQLRCALTGHDISERDEDELFSNPAGYLETVCDRCHYPVLLRIDPAERERNYYMLMER